LPAIVGIKKESLSHNKKWIQSVTKQPWRRINLPNQDKIDLATKDSIKPAESALNSSGNSLEQHAQTAVSEVETALHQALNSVSENATTSQALEDVRKQLTRAEEFLDQAQTSANALNLPNQT
jgi:membrane-associated HD superfamily phosphohydrolase